MLEAATRLFGRHGYAETSVDDIAVAAGTTTRPVYHYFGSKLGLFEVVADHLDAKLLEVLQDPDYPAGPAGLVQRFRVCLGVLAEPEFQRVVLVDAPTVLGKARWATSPVALAAMQLMNTLPLGDDPIRADLIRRMLIGALTEAALSLAQSASKEERERRIDTLVALASMLVVRAD